MATMNISLPQALKDWVEARAGVGLYANSSDYVRDLIRKDVEKHNKIAALREKVEEGERSGYIALTPDEIYERVKTRYDPER